MAPFFSNLLCPGLLQGQGAVPASGSRRRMVRSPWIPHPVSSSEVRHAGRAPGVCSDNRAAGHMDLVTGSQVFSAREAGAPSAQAQQEPRSQRHSVDTGARLCCSLPTNHPSRDSAKPGLTHLPKGVTLSLLPKGTDLSFKSQR